jgi:hypothetical protein
MAAGFVAAALTLGLLTATTTTSAAPATINTGGTAVHIAAVIRVPMTLNCTRMSASEHAYAVAHHYCPAVPHGGIMLMNTVPGTCGDSFMYVLNDADGGGAHLLYGFDSTAGTVIFRNLIVGWLNNTHLNSHEFSDIGIMASDNYEQMPPVYTRTGRVTAWLGGGVTLWWGADCSVDGPSDVNNIS